MTLGAQVGTVGNLGNYQRMVQLAKATNGPVALGIYVLAGGFLVGAAVGPTIKKGANKAYQSAKLKVRASRSAKLGTYIVVTEANAGMGLRLRVGDEFRVLEQDGDAVLVEVCGNAENPHVVSAKLLEEISDFTIDGD